MKNLIILSFLAVVLYGSVMIYRFRDVVFYWDFAKPTGEIRLEKNPELERAVDNFINATGTPTACVHEWFGRDDLFLYVKVLCDRFTKDGETVKRSGEGPFSAARLEYDPTTNVVQGLESTKQEDFAKMRALFPKQIYSIMRWDQEPSKELLEKGFARQSLM